MRRLQVAIFWAAAVVLILLVVPVTRNFGAIPATIFAVIVLATASAFQGRSTSGHRLIAGIASLVLIAMFLSFFLPKTAARVPGVIDSIDNSLAGLSTPSATTNTPVRPLVVVQKVVKIGKERTVVTFAEHPDGCSVQFLRGSWTSHPQGGDVSITALDGSCDLVDKPGVPSSSVCPAGNFRVCKKGASATGIWFYH